jgi:rfaE bifunctional protein kinase chain/domain
MPGMLPEREAARLRELIAAFGGKRILVIGDLMLDEFIWGRASRISPEAPVPVVDVVRESYYPGGAANVARNVREFGAQTAIMGLAGDDSHGGRLLDLLRSCGIDVSGVQCDAARATSIKTRIIARNQQVVRVDREQKGHLSKIQTDAAVTHLRSVVDHVDGVIIADYGKGFLTQSLADGICSMAAGRGKVLAVDPHPYTSLVWHGTTVIKPNRTEAFLAAGLPPSEPVSPVLEDAPLMEAGRRLMKAWGTEYLLITLGELGMLLLQGDGPPYHTPTRAREVFDVSGAGDTAIAVLTLALAAGAAADQAAELANLASGIAVGKLGTATVTAAELEAELARA